MTRDAPGGAPPPRGFVLAVDRCTGCAACELACSTENELGWGRSWRRVVTANEERRAGAPTFHLSLACHHCDAAPCVRECPTRALGRDAATGAVLLDEARCMGCRYCSWVCPYDAPLFDEERAVMTKCTLCHHRLREGREPACVEACPTDALGFGPLVGDEAIPGFPATPAKPRIRFTRPDRRTRAPDTTWELPADVLASFAAARPRPRARALSFRSEWPLWLFTTAVAVLVGWVLAAALVGTTSAPAGAVGAGASPPGVGGSGIARIAPGAPRLPVDPTGFVGLAAFALALATLHLGRTGRAWRAAANVRRSRLSREIVGVAAFLAVSLAALAWNGLVVGVGSGPGTAAGAAAVASGGTLPAWLAAAGAALPWLAGAAGLVALFLTDRVYDPVRTERGRPVHSADVLLTGPAFAAVLLEAGAAFAVLAAVKLALYVRRKLPRPEGAGRSGGLRRPNDAEAARVPGADARGRAWGLGAARVALGLVLPPLTWSLAPEGWLGWAGWAPLLFVCGELVDRAELYGELRPSPAWSATGLPAPAAAGAGVGATGTRP